MKSAFDIGSLVDVDSCTFSAVDICHRCFSPSLTVEISVSLTIKSVIDKSLKRKIVPKQGKEQGYLRSRMSVIILNIFHQ